MTIPNSARTIRYRIAAADPHAHVFEVACTIDAPDPEGQRFRMPTWIPGSYMIREFARNVVEARAHDPRGAVALTKEAKDVWRAGRSHGPLTVTIQVYAFDLSVRTAYLDATRGFFNGTSVFLLPEGWDDAGCEVEIVRAPGASRANWRVATSLPSRGASRFGFGRYGAQNYAELIDHPVEMSDFTLATFVAGGAEHEVAISGRHRTDTERLVRDLQKVCTAHCELFEGAGGRAPFDRYLFLVAAVGEGYGGLEHRASTSLLCRRDELPHAETTHVTDDYRQFLGLASHEYFHSWNVKRIKPAAFVPGDLAREAYTRELWAFEGITSYYDDLALVRSGVLAIDDYLELVGRTMTAVARGPGRHRQSVAESSFDAWIKYYRPDENTPNAVVSYYAKGSLVALALDLTLRRHGSSLDALMRMLWQRHGRTGIGVPEGAIAGMASELAGTSVREFFARYVEGTEDPPLPELLHDVGISVHARAASGPSDRGGKAARDREPRTRCWFGARVAGVAEARLQHVLSGGPAERAGLAAGDLLVAFDGLRASSDALEKLLDRRRPGETVTVHAFRRDELMVFECELGAAPLDTFWLSVDPAGDDIAAQRVAWLGR